MKSKIVDIILWGVIVISAFLIISLCSNISDNKNDPTMISWVNVNISWLYIVFAACAFVIVFFGIYYTVTDLASAKQGLIGVGFLLVIFLISYISASDEMPQFRGVEKYIADGTLTPAISRWISTGLISTYVLLFLAIGSMLVSPIMRLFNK